MICPFTIKEIYEKKARREAEDKTHMTDETYTAELIYDLTQGSDREMGGRTG